MKSSNWTSLLLTGDLKTLSYMEKKITGIPDSAFNFCCTIDGRNQAEANLSGINKPHFALKRDADDSQ